MSRSSLFIWTRRIHYALGLYLLLFIWLFALSGLLLNHQWGFAEFWKNRTETKFERAIELPSSSDDEDAAKDLMRQLRIRGEINKIERSGDGRIFRLDVARPGESYKVEASFYLHSAKITRTKLNGWGVFRTLHTFTGSKYNEQQRTRHSEITELWVATMVASAVGLIAMVLTSLYLWWRLERRRLVGSAALGAGLLVIACFLWGSRLL